MAVEKERRSFLGMALGGFTAVGGIVTLGAMKRTWDPLPSVKSAGFTTVDLSAAEENVLNVEKWRGKPIFILKKSADMEKHDRDVIVGDARFHVSIGLCTHLGCIPAYFPKNKNFICACHGGMYDVSGAATKAPPVKPLEIPPFKVDGMTLVLGEEGEEFKKMKAAGLTV
ncbi:MAG TPA: ubiquinol-cytochrome c reductase iron-sulfur subunit [Campylobacterales bacterium]|nr:ubiquinol-cytochrome c reductase iron-sulfur subunit [Campylobacterales bacterium]